MAEHELATGLLRFVLGGNATFTVLSESTQVRFTYKVVARKRNNDGKTIHFVSLLRGQDNVHDYAYMGCIIDEKKFILTQKSQMSDKATSVVAFRWMFGHLIAHDSLPKGARFYHEGRCGRCGRKLTVPESIESGFGPECGGRI